MIDRTGVAAQLDRYQQNRQDSGLTEQRHRVNQLANNRVNLTERLTYNLTELREANGLLERMLTESSDDEYLARIKSEWEQLAEHPRLAAARIDEDGRLQLTTTEDIYLHCDGFAPVLLGAFEITLGIGEGGIRLHNLTTRRGGRDHPHVVNGGPCFGGDAESVAQLHANGQLFVLFEILLQYLETLNLQDEYGRYGAYWFEGMRTSDHDVAQED